MKINADKPIILLIGKSSLTNFRSNISATNISSKLTIYFHSQINAIILRTAAAFCYKKIGMYALFLLFTVVFLNQILII